MTWTRDAAAALRADWLAVLDDACTISTNSAGQGTYSTVTKTYAGTPSQVYTGACLVRERSHSQVDYGQAQQQLVDYDVFLPADTTGLAVDQQLLVDTINSAVVPTQLEGQTMTILELGVDSWNARIRLGCKLNRGAG